ncbi:MAG: hypothetical protein Q9209_002932 [Squamulea sp. 1 TL-2023]
MTRLATSNSVKPSSQRINPSIPMPSHPKLSQINIPKDFRVVPTSVASQGPSEEAFFYNTIIALKELALGDYNGNMPVQSFASMRFPEPAIQFYGMDTVIPRKYIIWGLLISIYNMVSTADFRTRLVVLYYLNVEVGGITFGRPTTVNGLLHRHAMKGGTKLTGQPFNENHTATTPLAANRVTIDLTPFGSIIKPSNLFMTIISALSEAAPHFATTPLDGPFTSQFQTFPCRLATRPIQPPRRTPPVYEWRHLVHALGQVTEFVVGKVVSMEMTMSINVDGTTVGLAGIFDGERVDKVLES